MDSSIGFQLGIGSGLDIVKLVKSLSDAQRAPKEALIEKRETLNEARISGLAEVSGAIDNFSTALSSLIAGGSLFTQPTVSDPNVLSARTVAGARIGALSGDLEVVQLAKAQTLQSVAVGARTDPIGQGTLTLSRAAGNVDIVIGPGNDSLDGLASAINAAAAGVTASIVTDAGGARLVLKGASGAANAYTLSVPAGTTSGLERFAFGGGATGGMVEAQAAQDAVVKLDGVTVSRASNSFSDLIPGVQIDLKRASPGATVALGASRPTTEISKAVEDVVAAYNEVMKLIAEQTAPGINGAGGALRGDLGVRTLQRQLAQLPTTKLTANSNGVSTLAELGVRTNRDGTLSVDTGRLTAVLASEPDAVEAMFNPSQFSSDNAVTIRSVMGKVRPGTYTLTNLVPAANGASASGMVDGVAMTGVDTNLVAPAGSTALGLIVQVNAAASSVTITVEAGIGGALKTIRDALRDRTGPFATAGDRLKKEATRLADERATLELRSAKYYDQLLGTFTSMERQVSAFKATQSYLDQQVKMWTNDRG